MKNARTIKLLLVALCALPMVAVAQPGPIRKGPAPGGMGGAGWGAGGGPGVCPVGGPGLGRGAGGGGLFMQGNWWNLPRVKETLELTDDQIKTLGEQSREIRKQEIDLRADTEKARLDLEAAFEGDTVDEEKAMTAAKALGDLTGKRIELTARQRVLVAKTLTAEQREKAKGIMADRVRQQLQKRAERDPEMRARIKERQRDVEADKLRQRKREMIKPRTVEER
jgi:Spy/CpxP family protein refolding chaperone